jgi:hypothetical protein
VALLHDTACKILTKFIIDVNNIQQLFQRFPEAPLSLTMCSIFTGIPAWIMGKGDLRKIGAGVMDPEGGGMSKAGMICGIIATILGVLCGGFYLIVLIVAILSEVSN